MGELASNPTPIGDLATAWLDAISRVDGCPACPNTEPPKTWQPVPGGYFLAYLCSDCGAAWTHETKEK